MSTQFVEKVIFVHLFFYIINNNKNTVQNKVCSTLDWINKTKQIKYLIMLFIDLLNLVGCCIFPHLEYFFYVYFKNIYCIILLCQCHDLWVIQISIQLLNS